MLILRPPLIPSPGCTPFSTISMATLFPQRPVLFRELKLNPNYASEDVFYLTNTGLQNARVFVFKRRIYGRDGLPFSTVTSIRKRGKSAVGDMVVMDVHGNLYSHPKIPGKVHHSAFLPDGVAYAGLWEIDNGYITKLMAWSGHYQPNSRARFNFYMHLQLGDSLPNVYKPRKRKTTCNLCE